MSRVDQDTTPDPDEYSLDNRLQTSLAKQTEARFEYGQKRRSGTE